MRALPLILLMGCAHGLPSAQVQDKAVEYRVELNQIAREAEAAKPYVETARMLLESQGKPVGWIDGAWEGLKFAIKQGNRLVDALYLTGEGMEAVEFAIDRARFALVRLREVMEEVRDGLEGVTANGAGEASGDGSGPSTGAREPPRTSEGAAPVPAEEAPKEVAGEE